MATPLPEPIGISPRIDCVFRAILGDEDNTDRLIDFLNAVLQRQSPVVQVTIRNPAHLPDFVGDDHTVVDIKATDADGSTFQVEMQSWNHAALKERMLYSWADIYEGQLVQGVGYKALRPVIGIWILDENTLSRAQHFHHRFSVCDPERGVCLTPHLAIHVLELRRWASGPPASTPAPLAEWMRFLSEAERWAALPSDIHNPALESAMNVLQTFKTNKDWNETYRSRLAAQRLAITLEESRRETEEGLATALAALAAAEAETEQAKAATEQALADAARERGEKEAERAAKEAERAAKERLHARLLALGFDPDGG